MVYWLHLHRGRRPVLQKAYALFDFDGTLIKGDSIIRFCIYAWKKHWCNLGTLATGALMGALYLCGLTTAEASKQAALAFLKGRKRDEVDAFARAFCQEVLIPKLYKEGVDEIHRHQENGAEVWIISASTAFYLEPLREHLGLSGLIGTRMHVDENGEYSGLIDGHNCRGVEKTLRLAEVLAYTDSMVDYETSSAYGDTAGDIPMLMLCAHKNAVNPRKKLSKGLEGADGVQTVHWGK